jgi:hypothetical protein
VITEAAARLALHLDEVTNGGLEMINTLLDIMRNSEDSAQRGSAALALLERLAGKTVSATEHRAIVAEIRPDGLRVDLSRLNADQMRLLRDALEGATSVIDEPPEGAIDVEAEEAAP